MSVSARKDASSSNIWGDKGEDIEEGETQVNEAVSFDGFFLLLVYLEAFVDCLAALPAASWTDSGQVLGQCFLLG